MAVERPADWADWKSRELASMMAGCWLRSASAMAMRQRFLSDAGIWERERDAILACLASVDISSTKFMKDEGRHWSKAGKLKLN